MAYEYFYEGAPYSLEPEYGEIFTGYRIPASVIGASTSTQTANQIKEVTNLLNQGMKTIEVSAISPEVFEMIPKQHLKEINRLTKLTGSETSLHAPIIDPSGFTQQGWNEASREEAEGEFINIIERSKELNPEGNIPVTIHASSVPGTQDVPIELVKDLTDDEKDKYGKIGRIPRMMVAVNQETGEMSGLKREEMYYPGEGKMVFTPERRLEMRNDTQWDHGISNLNFYKKEADEMIDQGTLVLGKNYEKIIAGEISPNQLPPEEQKAWNMITKAGMMLSDIYSQFANYYDEARKYMDFKAEGEERGRIAKAMLNGINQVWVNFGEEQEERYKKLRGRFAPDTIEKTKLLDASIAQLNLARMQTGSPQLYKPIEEFTKEKASETLSSVALNAYKKFGDKSPIISLENPPYGTALAKAQDLKELIQKTKTKFVEKAVKQGYSESKAKDAADKLIGATWDTSHISMMRKEGFKPEELIKEAKTIAPLVKHVHLNDNFGHTHTDLPPGMGDVPMKEILKEMEKAGFEGKKIFEGGAWFQHFQTSPHPYVLEALGSPLYTMAMAPYWNQITSTYGNYFSGYGTMLPEQHFSMYGAGWAGLPTELGGQVPGRQSRLSGAPTA